jgi:hypothetical protein
VIDGASLASVHPGKATIETPSSGTGWLPTVRPSHAEYRGRLIWYWRQGIGPGLGALYSAVMASSHTLTGIPCGQRLARGSPRQSSWNHALHGEIKVRERQGDVPGVLRQVPAFRARASLVKWIPVDPQRAPAAAGGHRPGRTVGDQLRLARVSSHSTACDHGIGLATILLALRTPGCRQVVDIR